jgi:PAS domain S-box-containing protein
MARILCIDDELAALRLRAQILQHAGYTVATASTGPEALTKFRAEQFDLVVSDHVLGRGTGTQLAQDFRQINPEIPILILSGTSEIPADIQHADAFLSKLEGPKVFLEKIVEMLAKFKKPEKAEGVAPHSHSSADSDAAYEELRVSQARLAAIIASTMDAIVTIDENQKIVLFNKAAERIFGYRAQAIMGRPVDTLIPEDLRAAHRVHVRSFGETGITYRGHDLASRSRRTETFHHRPQGSKRA